MKCMRKLLPNLVLLVSLLLLASAPTFAQDGAQVYAHLIDRQADSLTVNIIAEDVVDLYGVEIHLTFDPGILTAQDADPDKDGIQIEDGGFLPIDQGFAVANNVEEAEGRIAYAVTLLNPAPPVSGSGTIARVTFDVLQDAPATIDIEKAKLVAVDLQSIPAHVVPLEIGAGTQSELDSAHRENGSFSPEIEFTDETTNENTILTWFLAGSTVIFVLVGLGFVTIIALYVWIIRNPKKGKSAGLGSRPQIWLRPVHSIRIQRPILKRARNAIFTRPNNPRKD